MPQNIVNSATGLEQKSNQLDLSQFAPEPSVNIGYNDLGVGSTEVKGTDFDLRDYSRYFKGSEGNSQMGVANIEALNSQRGWNQSAWEKLGKGLVVTAGSTLTKLGQGASYVGGGLLWLGRAAVDGDYSLNVNTFQDVYDNGMVNLFRHAEEDLKEALPIYGTHLYEEGSFFQRLGEAKFWASDGMDALAFLASAYVGGLGAFSAGSKLATKTAGLLSNAEKAARIGQIAGWGTSTAYNTINEAGFEARDMRDEIYKRMVEAGIDPKIAKEKAAEQAASGFLLNAGLLSLSNGLQMSMFFGSPFKAKQSMLHDIATNKTSSKNINVIKKTIWDGFGPYGLIPKGGVIPNMMVEGLWEEGMQVAVSNYEMKRAFGVYSGNNTFKDIASEWLGNWSTREGQDSMFLGAVIGLLGGSAGAYREAKEYKQRVEKGEQTIGELKKLLKLTDNNFIDYLKTKHRTDDKGKILLDPTTSDPITNQDWLVTRALDLLEDEEYKNERIYHILNGDEVATKLVDSFYLSRKLFNYLNNPTFANSNEAFKTMKERWTEDIKEYGQQTGENTDEALSKLMNEFTPIMDQLKIVYDKLDKKLTGTIRQDNELDFITSNKLKQMAFYLEAKKIALQSIDLSEASEQTKKDFEALIENSDKTLKTLLTDNKERKEFINEVRTKIKTQSEISRQISEITSKLTDKSTEEEKKEASLKIAKLTHDSKLDYYKNGYTQIERQAPNINLSFKELESQLLSTGGMVGKRNKYNFEFGKNEQFSKKSKEKIDSLLNKILDKKNKAREPEAQLDTNPEQVLSLEISQEEEQELHQAIAALFQKSNDPTMNYSKEDQEYLKRVIDTLLNQHVIDMELNQQKLDNEMIPLFALEKGISEDEVRQDLTSINSEYSKAYQEFIKLQSNNIMKVTEELIQESIAELSVEQPEVLELPEEQLESFIIESYLGFSNFTMNDIEILQKIIKEHEENLDTLKQIEKIKQLIEESKNKIDNNEYLTKYQKASSEEKEQILEREFLKQEYGLSSINNDINTFKNYFKKQLEEELSKITNIEDFNAYIQRLNFLKDIYSSKEDTPFHQELLQDFQEKIDYIEKNILPQIVKNLENRKNVQVRSFNANKVQIWSTLGIMLDFKPSGQFDADSFSRDTDIYKAIEAIVGKDILDSIIQASFNVPENFSNFALDIANVQKILNIIRESNKDKKELLEAIKKTKEEAFDLIMNSAYNRQKTSGETSAFNLKNYLSKNYTLIESYKNNPSLAIPKIIQSSFYDLETNNENFYKTALYKYLQDFSISEFKHRLNSNTHELKHIPSEYYENIIDGHLSYLGSKTLEDYVNAKEVPNITSYFETLQTVLKTEELAPNFQQEIAIKEAYDWYNGDKYFTYLRGVAGTGKTSVFLNYFLKTNKIDTVNVIGTAHNESAVNSLYNTLNPKENNKYTLNRILSETSLLDNKTLIVLDEANSNDWLTIKSFLDLVVNINTKRKAENKPLLKLLMMGDPTQISKMNVTSTTRNISFIDELTTNAANQTILNNMSSLSPFTLPYRSDVGAINTLSSKFQDSIVKHENLTFTHSAELNDPNALGAFSINQDRMASGALKGFIKRITDSKGNNRPKKAVIVSNQKLEEAYKKELASLDINDVEVINYIDAQGRTFDEVYVDVIKTDVVKETAALDYIQNHSYNTVMYTMISRATYLVAVMDETNTFTNNTLVSVQESSEELKKEKEALKVTMQVLNNFRLNILKGPKKEEVKKPDSKEIDKESEEQDSIDDDFDNAPEKENPVPIITEDQSPQESEESERIIIPDPLPESTEGLHIIASPNGKIITRAPKRLFTNNMGDRVYVDESGKERGIPLVEKGTEVVYVKSRKGSKDVIKVFARKSLIDKTDENNPSVQINGTPLYELLTIIYPENLRDEGYEAYLKKQFDSKKELDLLMFDNNNTTEQFLTTGENAILDRGKIEYVRDLSYKYSSTITKKGEGLFEYLAEQMMPLLTKKHLLDVDINDLSENDFYGNIKEIEVKIFSRSELQRANIPLDSRKNAGHPFAVITLEVPGIKNPIKQYIRLDPVKLNKHNPMLQPLLQFQTAINKIEAELYTEGFNNLTLGTNIFNRIANEYKDNYEAVPDGEDDKGKKKFKIQRKNVSVVTTDDLKLIFESEKIEATDEKIQKVHEIFQKYSDDIIKNVFTAKQTKNIVSFNGYIKFLERKAKEGVISQEDFKSLTEWSIAFQEAGMAIRKDSNTRNNLQVSSIFGLPDDSLMETVSESFTPEEISVLLSMPMLNSNEVYKKYGASGIKLENLPKPGPGHPVFKEGRTFKFFKSGEELEKITYVQYRIRQLRKMIGANSYVPIKDGPMKGKYFALDPLNGTVIVVDKIMDRGFTSISAAKRAGLVEENAPNDALDYKEIKLVRGQGEATRTVDALITANSQLSDGTNIRGKKVIKLKNKPKTVTFGPSLLSYKNDAEPEVSKKMLSFVRKTFNHWVYENRNPELLKQLSEKLTYIHPETGLEIPIIVQDREGLRDKSKIGYISREVDLAQEEVFDALIEFMINNQIEMKDGRIFNIETLMELLSPDTPSLQTMTSDMLNDMLNFDDVTGTNENMRTPLNMNYINSLSEQMNGRSKTGKTTEGDKQIAKQSLESLLQTTLEKVNPTSVHTKSDNYKESSKPTVPTKPGEPGSRVKPEAPPTQPIPSPEVSQPTIIQAIQNEEIVQEENNNKENNESLENVSLGDFNIDDLGIDDFAQDIESINDAKKQIEDKSTDPTKC